MPYQAGQGTDVRRASVRRAARQGAGPAVLSSTTSRAPAATSARPRPPRSPADGYTLLMGTVATQTMNEFLYPSLGYDSQKDFEPIILVGMLPMVISANPVLRGQLDRRAGRGGQGQARQDRHRAAQHDGAAGVRALEGADRRAAVRRALQGLGDGHDRGDRRAGAGDHRHRDGDARPGGGRQAEAARHHHAEVERADARREVGGRAGLRRVSRSRRGMRSMRRKGTPKAIVDRSTPRSPRSSPSPRRASAFCRSASSRPAARPRRWPPSRSASATSGGR